MNRAQFIFFVSLFSFTAPQLIFGASTSQLPITPFMRDLSRGGEGEDVENLQAFLTTKGYLSVGNVTGVFGPKTEIALQKFQCAQGIVCSGNASNGYGALNVTTRNSINALMGATSNTATVSVPIQQVTVSQPTPTIQTKSTEPASQLNQASFPRILHRDTEGSDVLLLQTYLAKDPTLFSVVPNGYFGPSTEQAIKRFQVRYGFMSGKTQLTTGYGMFGRGTQAKFIEVFGSSTNN
jgi:peptidoglycan hydrolase-like protein with peptidoglycan-binding domain